MFPGTIALWSVLAASALLAAGTTDTPSAVSRMLSLRPMRWVGRISYPLYLWHWPMIVAAAAKWGPLSWRQGVAVVAVSVVPAWASHRFVESPVRRSPRLARAPRASIAFGVALTLVGVTAGVGLAAALPDTSAPPASAEIAVQPLGDEGAESVGSTPQTHTETRPDGTLASSQSLPADPIVRPLLETVGSSFPSIRPDAIDARSDVPAVYDEGCHQAWDRAELLKCEFGAPSAAVTIALVGDSHAALWLPALRAIAEENGFRIWSFTKSACQFAAVDRYLPDEFAQHPSCDRWNVNVLTELKRGFVDLVITSGAHWYAGVDAFDEILPEAVDTASVLATAYEARWRDVIAFGIRLLVVRDVPYPQFDVPECVIEHLGALDGCAFDRAAATVDNSSQVVAAAATDVTLVDLTDWICTATACPAVVDGVLVWRDTNHLTATYAAGLGDLLLPHIASELVADR